MELYYIAIRGSLETFVVGIVNWFIEGIISFSFWVVYIF